MNYPSLQSGFTLVEMLIYIALLVIVSTGSVSFLISLDELVNQYQVETALYRSGTNVLEQTMVALRQADVFDALNSIEDDPANGRLTLTNSASTTELIINGSGGIDLLLDGVNYGDLTGDSVSVNSFTVYRYDTAVGQMVRVRVDLTATIDGYSKNMVFYGGAVVRGAL